MASTFLLSQSLSPVSDEQIASLIQCGDIGSVIRHNIRLVYKIAHSFKMVNDNNLEDAVQEGCLGIVKSCERYELGKAKFSTYIGFGIRNRIINMIYRNNMVSVCPSAQGRRKREGKEFSLARSEGDHIFKNMHAPSDDSHLMIEDIQFALSSLKGEEETLLRRRYGVDTKLAILKELSEETGLSGERIRQKQKSAERSLRRVMRDNKTNIG